MPTSDWEHRRIEFLQQITKAQEDLFFLELDDQALECWGGDRDAHQSIKSKLNDCRIQIENLTKVIQALDRLYTQH